MDRTLVLSILVALLLALILGAGIGYLFGYDHGTQSTSDERIDSFEDCAAAGYPIMESYPEQCRTPDGTHFVREIPEETEGESVPAPSPLPPSQVVACPMDARICADGTAVGRIGPHCEFAPCPGE